MSRDSGKHTIVIDNGSAICKAGFSNDDIPRIMFPAAIGRPRQRNLDIGKIKRKEFYIGNEFQAIRDIMSVAYPIQRGIVTNWDDMEKIWSYLFVHGLHVRPNEHDVVITEAALNPKGNREYMAQVMFETFEVPGMYVPTSGATSIYSPGRCTGVVLDCGEGVTQIVPIYEGWPISQGVRRMDFAGTDVTRYLQKSLNQNGYSFSTSSDLEIVREIKQQLCYTSFDFQKETATEKNSFILPDGKKVTVGDEMFQSTEILFQPSLVGRGLPGIHELLYESIMACDCDVRRDLFTNIILSGGSTMSPGFHERFSMEITSKVKVKHPATKVMAMAPPERSLSAWLGGSILAHLPSIENYIIPKRDYDEVGPSIMCRGIF